jgi:hypothetical protein
MTISTYQIRNVLRVYGNQLKRKSRLSGEGMESHPPFSEFVHISLEARKKQVIDQISTRLVSGLTSNSRESFPGEPVPLERVKDNPIKTGEPYEN